MGLVAAPHLSRPNGAGRVVPFDQSATILIGWPLVISTKPNAGLLIFRRPIITSKALEITNCGISVSRLLSSMEKR